MNNVSSYSGYFNGDYLRSSYEYDISDLRTIYKAYYNNTKYKFKKFLKDLKEIN